MLANNARRTSAELLAGRYALRERLGGGHIAETYRADDQHRHLPVVVKVRRGGSRHDQDAARFEREILAAAAVRHPNVVAIIDSGVTEGQPFFVMEWVDGGDLKRLIRQRAPLSMDTAVAITVDILQGLAAIHRVGIIHRDIKPQNILLDRAGTAKVADFGIAHTQIDDGLTETGVVLGSAAYLAPERAAGTRPAGPAADLYATGVILYELLTGRLPFEADTAAGVLYQHVHVTPTPPQALNSTIPAAVGDIVLRSLAKDPAGRYGSAESMIADLVEAVPTASVASVVESTQSVTPIPPPPTGTPGKNTMQPHGSPKHALPVMVLVLALLIGGISLAARDDDSPEVQRSADEPISTESVPTEPVSTEMVETQQPETADAPAVVTTIDPSGDASEDQEPNVSDEEADGAVPPAEQPVDTDQPGEGRPDNPGNGQGNGPDNEQKQNENQKDDQKKEREKEEKEAEKQQKKEEKERDKDEKAKDPKGQNGN
jgi:serine/threonine-protein kinase